MAYMNQDQKNTIVARVKEVIALAKKDGLDIRASFRVENYSTLIMKINRANVDLVSIRNASVNREDRYFEIYLHDNLCENVVGAFSADEKVAVWMQKIAQALMTSNYDKSDIMTDYFNVGYYCHIEVGGWNKEFQVI